jgi:putative transposase
MSNVKGPQNHLFGIGNFWIGVAARSSHESISGKLLKRETRMLQAQADVCRKHGISSATFYKWKAKHGGLEVSDAKRLKALEDENAELAEAMLDNAMLKEVAPKNDDARREARPCRSCADLLRGERAAGVCGPGSRPLVGALSQ